MKRGIISFIMLGSLILYGLYSNPLVHEPVKAEDNYEIEITSPMEFKAGKMIGIVFDNVNNIWTIDDLQTILSYAKLMNSCYLASNDITVEQQIDLQININDEEYNVEDWVEFYEVYKIYKENKASIGLTRKEYDECYANWLSNPKSEGMFFGCQKINLK